MALVRLMRFDDDRVTGEQDRASSPTTQRLAGRAE